MIYTDNRKASWIIKVKLNLHDIWIGAYWESERYDAINWYARTVKVYICLIPLIPIKIGWQKFYDK